MVLYLYLFIYTRGNLNGCKVSKKSINRQAKYKNNYEAGIFMQYYLRVCIKLRIFAPAKAYLYTYESQEQQN
jgi:hypothetical protein